MATTHLSTSNNRDTHDDYNRNDRNNNANSNRFDNLINRYRTRGLIAVADFLLAKSRKSKRTVLTFSFVIDYLNEFICQNYNSYDIQTVLTPIKKGEIDVYKLLNDFVNYLQNNTANGSNLSTATFNLYIIFFIEIFFNKFVKIIYEKRES